MIEKENEETAESNSTESPPEMEPIHWVDYWDILSELRM